MAEGFIFETERLRARELRADDLNQVAAWLLDPEVMSFWPRPMTREESVNWIQRFQKSYEVHGFGHWMIEDKSSSVPLGQAGILMHRVDGVDQLGVGYLFGKEHWGKGYATEAARACLNWAFTNTDAERILCLIRPSNQPSIRVAKRLHLKLIGETEYAEFNHLIYAAFRIRATEFNSPSS